MRLDLSDDVLVFAARQLPSGQWELVAPAVRELSQRHRLVRLAVLDGSRQRRPSISTARPRARRPRHPRLYVIRRSGPRSGRGNASRSRG
jgi:hypothetical protein